MRNRPGLAVLLLAMLSAGLSAQAPTKWRGPDSGGKYPDTGLLKKWPVGGPQILWSYEELGQGHSSAVVSGDFIYASGMINTQGYLFKFDMDGNLVYRANYGPEYKESYYGTRGSPVIAGDRIYIINAYGHLYCLRESDGKKVWSVDMPTRYGGRVLTWGYCETPVIDGDVIYCTPGGARNNLLALNRHNGELIWSCPGKGELSAYCTPLLFTHNGRKIIATHTASSFIGVDAATGKLLWSRSHPNQWSVHPNTPIYHEGSLFYFSGYGRGGVLLNLNQDGSKVTREWENATLDSRMGGAVLVDGYLYSSGDYSRDWKCVDWKTGKKLYSSMAIGPGVVIYADGMLYCYSQRGELAMVRAGSAGFDLISQARVEKGSEQHWAHPVIHDGVLYLRHGKALIAYKIK